VITITGIGDHLRPEWLITFTGIRTQAGMSREDACAVVQRQTMAAWQGGAGFADRLKADSGITRYLSLAEIDGSFDTADHLKHVDTIFRRVFGDD
jgi:adenylosuccinate lyase